ncbi:MAG: hypothetical protein ACOCY0_05105, partial [Roseicyclus sp.]
NSWITVLGFIALPLALIFMLFATAGWIADAVSTSFAMDIGGTAILTVALLFLAVGLFVFVFRFLKRVFTDGGIVPQILRRARGVTPFEENYTRNRVANEADRLIDAKTDTFSLERFMTD